MRLPDNGKVPKPTITLRLDADVIEWLRAHPNYNARLNIWLRKLMQRRRRRKAKRG